MSHNNAGPTAESTYTEHSIMTGMCRLARASRLGLDALCAALLLCTACTKPSEAPAADGGGAVQGQVQALVGDGFAYGEIFRVAHTATGAANLTDFQVQVKVNTATEIANGRMRSDCADIRVYAGNGCTAGTPVNFWVADGTCNTTTTNVWLGLPSVLADSVTSFAIYWGDLNATSASSGSTVFPIFFDDFNDGSIDTNKWDTYATNPLTESGGRITNGGGASAIWTKQKVMTQGQTVFGVGTNAQSAGGADIEYGASTMTAPGGVGNVHWSARTYTGATYMSYDATMAFIGRGSSAGQCVAVSAGSRWANAPGDPTWFQTEFFYEWVANDQTRFGIYDKFGVKREITLGNASCKAPATESAYYQWDHSSDPPNPISSLDYAYVRKYANPDPLITDRTTLALAQCLANGSGPCSISTASAACASGACSSNALVCIPPLAGACYVDADCGNGQFCDRSDMACKTKLAVGSLLPTDGVHNTCSGNNTNAACANGLCNTSTSSCAAVNGTSCQSAAECVVNVCDTDGHCGYASGGTCSQNNLGVCRATCGVSGMCLPPDGCDRDTGCDADQHCNIQTLGCVADLSNGVTIPSDHGACGAAAGSAGDALDVCSSGHCNEDSNTCAAANGGTCSTSAECESDVCGSDGKCGYANGAGPCNSLTESTVCRSQRCSLQSDACVPDEAGSCWVDGDCTSGKFCHRDSFTCTDKLATGAALPMDDLHESCPSSVNTACASGLCNQITLTCAKDNDVACTAANGCVTNVCDSDNKCGYANGGGSCDSGEAAPQCRSGVCSNNEVCIPNGGCAADSDCDEGEYCMVSTLQCAPALANGFALPAGHGTCSTPGNAGSAATACASGTCNPITNTCAGANTDTTCTGASECIVNLCGANGKCGRANGQVGCTDENADEVCQSGTCSVSTSVCIPAGISRCWSDDDCASDNYCHRTTFLCTGRLPAGSPIPGDDLHDACPPSEVNAACASGTCNRVTNTCAAGLTSSCTAAAECVSNVCDGDSMCGYANGNGPCTADTQTDVCRSGICNNTGRCIPSGGCGHDSECPAERFCRAADFSCAVDLSNGSPLLAGHGACGESGSYGDANSTCASGRCNSTTGTCAGVNTETHCSAASECVNNICGANGRCGFSNGDASSCTPQNAVTRCQSGVCSTHGGRCVPKGEDKCWVDQDCAEGAYCHRATLSCENSLISGGILPDDGLHARCNSEGTSRACGTGLCDPETQRCVSLNSVACSAAEACLTGVCGKNGQCGYDVGEGPCNADNAESLCQSGVCAQSGVCIATGEHRCWVDVDCAEGSYCDRAEQTCRERIAAGAPVPNDELHTGCSDGTSPACSTGLCSSDSGLCVASNNISCDTSDACASSICGENGKCGHADGEGPCSQDDAADSCQSGKCSPNGDVCMSSECWVDADCGSSEYCERSTQSCAKQRKSGVSLPDDGLHDSCEDGASHACASGRCEKGRCVDPESAFGVAGGGGCSTAGTTQDSSAGTILVLVALFWLGRGRRRPI